MQTYRLRRSRSSRLPVKDPTPLLLNLLTLPFSFLLLLFLLCKTRGDLLLNFNLMLLYLVNRTLAEVEVAKVAEGCHLHHHRRKYL
jgi:hypothetical protein